MAFDALGNLDGAVVVEVARGGLEEEEWLLGHCTSQLFCVVGIVATDTM